ncbi:uncharacterized protein LOC132641033 isoform X5 [Lycium barbarum]|uniref:uncharacterized protein LOC132641033 isoform X5 n=1 Tax=Lycium barbarum TaxID=112863 RepID=UPI00293F18DC|nr:uncharacterized protein LOC132641033 isoform X5 [Lycium barbarum]
MYFLSLLLLASLLLHNLDYRLKFRCCCCISGYVMIVLKGSVPISFGGTEQPAAYAELVSIGGLNADVNKKFSAAIAETLETKLSIPKSQFFRKFYDAKVLQQIHLSSDLQKDCTTSVNNSKAIPMQLCGVLVASHDPSSCCRRSGSTTTSSA